MSIQRSISAELIDEFERRFYSKINRQAQLKQLLKDDSFWRQPESHVAIFPDHGVVHMRDVSHMTLAVLDHVYGVLIPERAVQRRARMGAYAELLACLHDIGMVDLSDFSRRMHPQYAAQAVFSADFDDIITKIARDNGGNIFGHLQSLSPLGLLAKEPMVLLRELLAMSLCHSKSAAPVELLNDKHALRSLMLNAVGLELRSQSEGTHNVENRDVSRFYDDFWKEAFTWLEVDDGELADLRDDLIDVLRVLRCADALRQRGTVLKTSGGYEIMVDGETAEATIAFRLADNRLYLLRVHDAVAAGEANIACCVLDHACNLRIAFHRGSFASPGAAKWAAQCMASVIDDISRDAIDSFRRPDSSPTAALRIILEEVDDNLTFAASVKREMSLVNPLAADRVDIVPSLRLASPSERRRYLAAEDLKWDENRLRTILERVERAGHPPGTDSNVAFSHVRLIRLAAGDLLIDADAPSAFVYIPLDMGLEIVPLGGYDSFSVKPWMPLGLTGVISGTPRNAAVRATTAVSLLMIPSRVFLQHWYHTHTIDSFARAVGR